METYICSYVKDMFLDFICDLVGALSPFRTMSGTLPSRRIDFCCRHSRRTQTACTPLSDGGSTTAEYSLNRTPLTSAPGSDLLMKLHERRKELQNFVTPVQRSLALLNLII